MDGEETFLFLSNRRDREPNSGVKGGGAYHYPKAPARLAAHQTRDVEPMLIQRWIIVCDAGRA